MKRTLIFTGLLLLLPFTVIIKAQEQAPLKGVIMGTAVVNDDLDNDSWAGGFKVGTMVSLDADKGLYVRTMFTRSAFGPSSEDIESLSIAVLSEWYLGKKFGFYAAFGGDAYISGDFNGTDPFIGFGLSRIMWTDKEPGFKVPAQVEFFTEVMFDDGDVQKTGGYIQLNLGLTFTKPVKAK